MAQRPTTRRDLRNEGMTRHRAGNPGQFCVAPGCHRRGVILEIPVCDRHYATLTAQEKEQLAGGYSPGELMPETYRLMAKEMLSQEK